MTGFKETHWPIELDVGGTKTHISVWKARVIAENLYRQVAEAELADEREYHKRSVERLMNEIASLRAAPCDKCRKPRRQAKR